MSESFEEFLEKKKFFAEWQIVSNGISFKPQFPVKSIELKDLGEWVWVKWLEVVDDCMHGEFADDYAGLILEDYKDNVHYEIAVACLGKREIEKRLKEQAKKRIKDDENDENYGAWAEEQREAQYAC